MEEQKISIIDEFRAAQRKADDLAGLAQGAMQKRYSELLQEAAKIQTEFKASFGKLLGLPVVVKSFTLAPVDAKPVEPTPSETNGKKIGGLRRSLNAALKNQDRVRFNEVLALLQALNVTDLPAWEEINKPEPNPVTPEQVTMAAEASGTPVPELVSAAPIGDDFGA